MCQMKQFRRCLVQNSSKIASRKLTWVAEPLQNRYSSTGIVIASLSDFFSENHTSTLPVISLCVAAILGASRPFCVVDHCWSLCHPHPPRLLWNPKPSRIDVDWSRHAILKNWKLWKNGCDEGMVQVANGKLELKMFVLYVIINGNYHWKWF